MKSRPSKTVPAGKTKSRPAKATTKASLPAAAAGSSILVVFLVGFMGAGKSTVGRALSQRLNWMFEDLDDRIERRERRRVAEIFRDSGEFEFRRAERAALQSIFEELRGGARRIVALGGGTFAQEDNHKAILASGAQTVFLKASLKKLWQRCAEDRGAKRPLQTDQNQFRKAYKAREQYYRTASLHIETAGRTVDEIAAEIMASLQLKGIEVRTEEGDSE